MQRTQPVVNYEALILHVPYVAVIYGLLSTDNNAFIEKGELIRFLRDFEPHFDYADLSPLFEEGGDRATFDQFCRWAETRPHALSLFEWLLSPESNANLSLVNQVDTPTFYQTLSGVTHLEEQEIVELEKRFWSLAGNSGSGQVDVDIIAPLVSPPLPEVLVSSLTKA